MELDVEHQERRQVTILEGANDLEVGESNPVDVEELEREGVDEELPDTATAILWGVTRTSNK